MTDDRKRIEQAIQALETQRTMLGDAVVDASLVALKKQLEVETEVPDSEQRKLVTVLFADISDFTALSEKMDAEDVQNIMRGYFARWSNILEKHGGRVEKFIGDAVMAEFGFDVANEVDPEQAIRSALDMCQSLDEYNTQLEREYNLRLNMRVGINTGMVMEGSLHPQEKNREATAIGDTVNVASRLEHAAPVGGILISHDTYRYVRGVFDVQTQSPLEVKGKADSLTVYLVLRAKPRAFRQFMRGVEGVETRMIGRDAEFKQLQDSFQTVIEDKSAQIVTVVAEPGIGKSRLLYEFENWIDLRSEQVWTFRARADLQTRMIPFGLFRDLLADRFEILDNDSAALAREKLIKGVSGFIQTDAEARSHFIGHLMGLDFSSSLYLKPILSDPQQMRAHTIQAVTELFKSAGNAGPAILYLEDIHWADDSSLELVAYLANELRRSPILILCMTRPTLYERRPQWGSGLTYASRVELRPLSKMDSRRLIDEILQKMPDVPSTLRELVTGSSEGNPFYMEELIKMLIDDGVILTNTEGWRVEAGKLIQTRVPPTLTGVLQARLDSLPAEEKRLLQHASVVGRVFWDALVTQIGEGEEKSNGITATALAGLMRRELIYLRENSTFAGAKEYIFKHNLLRDITYEMVLKRQRKIYHGQVASWLVAQSGVRANENAALIAEHYEKAGEFVNAAEYLNRAAMQSFALQVYDDAIVALKHALKILPVASDEIGEDELKIQNTALLLTLYTRLGEVYSMGKSAHEQSKPILETALALARKHNDDHSRATILGQLGRIAMWQGEYDKGIAYLQEALPLAHALDDRPALVFLLRQLGNIASSIDDFAEAQSYLTESLELARELKDVENSASALNSLGANAQYQGMWKEALVYYEEALATFRLLGERREVASVLANIGNIHCQLGDYATGQQYASESLILGREIGNQATVAEALGYLGTAALGLGETETARSYLDEALRLNLTISETPQVIILLPDYARLYWQSGQTVYALNLLGLARAHPASGANGRQVADKVLAELRKLLTLTDEEVEAGLVLGSKLDLNQVVEKLLK